MAQNKFIIDGGFTTNAASSIAGQLDMTGSILPTVDSNGTTGYDLGSTTKKWRDMYLSQGSLYINNQKVLEDDSGTIIVSADTDQGVTVKTTGTGVTALQSATTINMNGTLQMGATKKITDAAGTAVGFGDKIDMDSNKIINLGAPTANGDATTKLYVDGAISDLVNGAPGALDTLNEIANALGDDANYAATITTSLAAATTDRALIRTEFAAADTAINTAWAAADAAQTTSINSAWAAADAAQTTSINSAWAAADTADAIAWAAADAAQTTALQTYADTAETDAVATAAADATSKADAALVAAVAADVIVTNAHVAADAVVTTAMQAYADQAEADAESAAATDATTKANAALAAAVAADIVVTNAHVAADAVVTTAFAAADTAQTSSINSAWAAADTAQTSSINSAWAAADAAQTTALQTYADTSETDAIASAAADATAKVGALETSLLEGAPGALSTLNDLAAAMGDDVNHAATMTNLIAAEATTARAAEVSNAAAIVSEASTARAAESANAAAITAGDAAVTSAMQSYADQAEADAESAAASDATSKADAALAAAKVYADANDANDNTTYTAGNGMTLSGTQFLMSGSYTGSFTATGDVTAYSDDSLKTNVQVIDGALGRVEAIRGVTFDRIEDGSTSTGVIAQELKAVLPEAVHTDADGIHSVAYGNITGLLIEAIKELSAQVEVLKAK